MSYSCLLQELEHCAAPGAGGAVPAVKHIVRFENSRELQTFMRELRERYPALLHKAKITQLRTIPAVVCTVSSFPEGRKFQGIRYVEADARASVHGLAGEAAAAPAMPGEELPIPWGVRQIRAPLAWKWTTGRSVRVGVIDTGADYRHPDLKHSLARGINLLYQGALPQDDNGHGTHISGTIAACALNASGMTGTAPGAVIYPVKAFDRFGSAYVSDIIRGIEWCLMNSIWLINMSFGMAEDSRSLREAVAQACRRGAVLVASAGNEGKRGVIDYPGRYPETVCVGATDRRRRLASFSNRGKMVDIYAPGSRIFSTWLNNGYQVLSGTSMAASHVTGAIALAMAAKPDWPPGRIVRMLKQASWAVKSGADKNGPGKNGTSKNGAGKNGAGKRKSSGSQAREIDAYKLIRLLRKK